MATGVTCQVDFDWLSKKGVRARMSSDKPPAIFISGSLGLDFLNTLATPVNEQVDWIDDGDGLLAWLEESQLVSAKVLQALKGQAMPGEIDGVAAQARNLREWFRGFVRGGAAGSSGPTTCVNWSH